MALNRSQYHFGMVAIDKGFVTACQVLHALEEQMQEQSSTGYASWIGTILLKHSAITFDQLDEVLESLKPH